MLDCNEIVIDSVFLTTVAIKIINDFEPKTINGCRKKT